MKKIAKWALTSSIAAIAILFVTFVVIIHQCNNPKTEPISIGFKEAAQIWTPESKSEVISIQVDELVMTIEVSSIPTVGTSIKYSDEAINRDIFPQELYFGANDIRFDKESGIIYIKVIGKNAVCGPLGERIFEFDSRQRIPIRNYWSRIIR